MKAVPISVREIRAVASWFRRRRVDLLATGLIIGLLIAACGGGSSPRDSSATTPEAAQESATSQPGTADQESEDSAANGPDKPDPNNPPGTEEFGLSEEELVTAIEDVEVLISTCMSEAGFEYVAADYRTVRRGMTSDKSLPGLSEEQYIDQYGFGISTLYTGLPPQLAEAHTPATIGLGEQNVRIFNNMPPADQVAYNRTLLGEYSDATFAVAIETEDFSLVGGCTLAAIEQVFTPEQLTTTYLNPKDALIEQDPRMVAALAEFADCLHSAGFEYNREREIEPDLKRRLHAIAGGAPVESLSADARAALTALQAEEVALAKATFECEDDILDPVESQVERELFAGRQG